MDGHRQYFIEALKHHYPETFDEIVAETDHHFRSICAGNNFLTRSRNPLDKRLEFSSYFLALIMTIDVRGETFESIRKICLEIVTSYVSPKNKVHLLLKRLPAKLANTWLANIFIRSFNKRLVQNTNPEGFVARIITDKRETFGLGYGIDILECGICKLFKKHHYEKYASILCEVDAITSRIAGLVLVRMGTIANGATKCDFRFKKISDVVSGKNEC
ncbi:MAG TPA: L-2-amino-thiazoline-4-carboxylic acid hydrolase [Chryseolinea sp.]|nr:L-2-amino-thiazoline-4-carboxylic acid hydrolase [Chryseolinea sp.]